MHLIWVRAKLWIVRLVAWMTVGGGLVGGAWCQGQAAVAVKAPVFEVASVRLSPPGGDGMTVMKWDDGPRVTLRNCDLSLLLELAYGVDDYQITGVPKWAESAEYDVSAKVEGDVALSYEQLKPLLQQLLIERLHLKVHRAMKDFKGYALVVGKGGAKLQVKTDGGGRQGQIMPGALQAWSVNMDTFASMLVHPAKRPVVNKTGIAGEYDVKLEYAPESATDSPLPSLFTALQETLGLRLDVQMVPVQMLVVDAVDKVPVEN